MLVFMNLVFYLGIAATVVFFIGDRIPKKYSNRKLTLKYLPSGKDIHTDSALVDQE